MSAIRVAHEIQIDALTGKERPQLCTERVLAEPPDQCRRCAEFRSRDRLVRALAAWEIKNVLAENGLAEARMALGSRHHIHVDAAGDEHTPHALIPEFLLAPDLKLLLEGVDVGQRRQ